MSSTPTYTDDQLKDALSSLYGPNPDETCSHLHGYGDPEHKLSMLQRITATRVLDYEKLVADPTTPTESDLQAKTKEFHASHGPILNLQSVIQSQSPAMALAGEFKRASPSKGDIATNLNAGEQAAKYASSGASTISVLTETRWFKGSLDDLTEARIQTTGQSYNRPAILRKDFVINKYQIIEAASCGADTILLIVAVTPADLLKELIDYARSIGMEPLVEVHAGIELDVALGAGAKVIGVNNRNLHTFQMDLSTTDVAAEELKKRDLSFNHDLAGESEKPEYSLCSLSGMSSAHDVDRYRQVGVGMCLIGESLMRAADPSAAIQALCLHPDDYASQTAQSVAGSAYTAGTKLVKVCGITNPDDALVACRSGASLIGVIFAEKSKRKVSPEQASDVVNAVRGFGERSNRETISLPNIDRMSSTQALVAKSRALEMAARRPLVVGVFQNQEPEFIREMVEKCGLDLVQLHGKEGMKAASVENCGVPAIRVVDIETGKDGNGGAPTDITKALLDSVTSDPIAILLDTSIKGSKEGGGTGVTFDWGIAEDVQNSGLPVIIAGGLKPDNVDDAVTKIRPWGIDVSSGVEEKPGKKNVDKVQTFVQSAKQAAVEAQKGF
mmetsp:Transcript_27003/g.39101  ORF Transcript_27003/g.39101 Transcript_27003/m.39101 type:complete len:614 (-) Transcript_27003:1763-3604(-)